MLVKVSGLNVNVGPYLQAVQLYSCKDSRNPDLMFCKGGMLFTELFMALFW